MQESLTNLARRRSTGAIGVAIAIIGAASCGSDSNDPTATGSVSQPARIAFVRWAPGENRGQEPLMWTSDIDGGDEQPVGDERGWYMEWSSDHGLLLFDREDEAGDNQIWMVRPDGTGLRQLTAEAGFTGDGDLSPDDQTVVHTRAPVSPDEGGTGTLWVMNVDGSDARPLIDPAGAEEVDDWEPSFSPDGSQILFGREFANGASAVFVADADGSDVRQLMAPQVYIEHARWSPDGRTAIYNIEFAADLDDPRNGIWTVPVSGGQPTMLLATDDRFHVFKPDYSPDGSRIVFGCLDRVERQEDICVMNADGSDVQKVTDTPDFENHPVWR
jgi:TolB protein